MKNVITLSILLATLILISSCSTGDDTAEAVDWNTTQDSTAILFSITGLDEPESVRYDPDQDLYFISHFNGNGSAADSNGYIAKAGPDGTIQTRKFMEGTEAYPFHSGRGMFITGDSLWVADVYGIHAFHRLTGDHITFVDFSRFDPGFINDIAAGPDRALYVTDTGTSRLYRVANGSVTLAADSLPAPPNGITLDAETGRMLLASWGRSQTVLSWHPGTSEIDTLARAGGGNYDGIEQAGPGLLVASQIDSTLYHIRNTGIQKLITLPGRPADIGIDTRRSRIAIPFVSRGGVDIWQLPK